MFPIWVYVAVAALIAIMAFAIGQMAPGMGMMFVVLASTLWTAFSARRARLAKRAGAGCARP